MGFGVGKIKRWEEGGDSAVLHGISEPVARDGLLHYHVAKCCKTDLLGFLRVSLIFKSPSISSLSTLSAAHY